MSTFELLLIIITIHFAICIMKMNDDKQDGMIENRIIGGEAINIGTYPFTISIQWRYTGRHHCGGTYIVEKFVLTAAHCIVRSKGYYWSPESPWLLNVVAGTTTLWYSPTRQISNVKKLIPHPFFSYITMAHDIGIIKISKPFRLTRNVNYVPLPVEFNRNLFSENNKECIVIGWGKTSVTSAVSSGTLQHATVPLISTDRCNKYFYHQLHDGQICAGFREGGVDACQGDSGGPLICNGTQVGLVSWGHGCAVADSPGVYCRLDFYLDWINDTILTNTSNSQNDSYRQILHFSLITNILYSLANHKFSLNYIN